MGHGNSERRVCVCVSANCLCVYLRLCDRKETEEQWEREGKDGASVCNLLLRFGDGRFDSSTPISLLWHSSPLNRIDYWFCSLRSPSPPSDSPLSRGAEEEHHCVTSTQSCITRTNRDGDIQKAGVAAQRFQRYNAQKQIIGWTQLNLAQHCPTACVPLVARAVRNTCQVGRRLWVWPFLNDSDLKCAEGCGFKSWWTRISLKRLELWGSYSQCNLIILKVTVYLQN